MSRLGLLALTGGLVMVVLILVMAYLALCDDEFMRDDRDDK